MACDCFEKVSSACENRIRHALGEQLAKAADFGFEHTLWHFNGGDHSPIALNYRFRYYRRRKNGQPESRQSNADTSVVMRYCPFCGTEFKGDSLNKVVDHEN